MPLTILVVTLFYFNLRWSSIHLLLCLPFQSDYSSSPKQSCLLSAVSSFVRDDQAQNLRMLQRTLSEDVRPKHRDRSLATMSSGMAGTSFGLGKHLSCSQFGMSQIYSWRPITLESKVYKKYVIRTAVSYYGKWCVLWASLHVIYIALVTAVEVDRCQSLSSGNLISMIGISFTFVIPQPLLLSCMHLIQLLDFPYGFIVLMRFYSLPQVSYIASFRAMCEQFHISVSLILQHRHHYPYKYF